MQVRLLLACWAAQLARLLAAAGAPATDAWAYFKGLNRLRAAGLSCPGGAHFPPNPVPLIFDCALWKAAESILLEWQETNSSSRGLAPYGSILGPGSAEDALELSKSSEEHCRKMMDPTMKVVGTSSRPAQQPNEQRYWMQLFAANEVLGELPCRPSLGGEVAASWGASNGSSHGPTWDASQDSSNSLTWDASNGSSKGLAMNRRMKDGNGTNGTSTSLAMSPRMPDGNGTNGTSNGSSTAGNGTTGTNDKASQDDSVDSGPGETFGMVLLIVAVSLFCMCTFGSIVIGNIVLSRKEAREQKVQVLKPHT